ncbi:rap1 GTPase-activating protein 1 [Erpetoichthys calabaricus]|uniref:Rap1 GTPase-activating protein 1-like n=1 Tax=Erpetoichthys calabaricus TaxID=27687 RepID=A0A8C4S7N1_ERPCA|nr:rap1 GTPase-activating protein 1 [Erpetoichthys calabaricus]
MERKRDQEKPFTRKRSFTFGAYGGADKFFACTGYPSKTDGTHRITDILDSASQDMSTLYSGSVYHKTADLFEMIEKMQGSRLDEQRCVFPPPHKTEEKISIYTRIQELIKQGKPIPLILVPPSGGYRMEESRYISAEEWSNPDDLILESKCSSTPATILLERDPVARIYRQHFFGKDHQNFYGTDSTQGNVVLSVRQDEGDLGCLRLILRMKSVSLHRIFSSMGPTEFPSICQLAKLLCEDLNVEHFYPVVYPKASQLIRSFDEHLLSDQFKFGVLFQREGQLTEEAILSNCEETLEFAEFLSVLGKTVPLSGYTGFRGGLDVCYGQTGVETVVTRFAGKEIMFHVATKLPFTEGDPQQLQRKRHIGNDIVSVVFQEGQTPFSPDAIASNFLHAFLVVRRKREERPVTYEVSVVTREDVPEFGPPLPRPPIFTKGALLREFLLNKLINAEIACYQAEKFKRLEERTRGALLDALHRELISRSQIMLRSASPGSDGECMENEATTPGGFLENFKRAIRVRSQSLDTSGPGGKKQIGGSPQKHRLSRDSMPRFSTTLGAKDNTSEERGSEVTSHGFSNGPVGTLTPSPSNENNGTAGRVDVHSNEEEG